jgi:hypothetical protein
VAPVHRLEPPPRPHAAINPRPGHLHREQEQQALLVRAKTCGHAGQPTPWAGPAPSSSAACCDVVASLLASRSPCPTPCMNSSGPMETTTYCCPRYKMTLFTIVPLNENSYSLFVITSFCFIPVALVSYRRALHSSANLYHVTFI